MTIVVQHARLRSPWAVYSECKRYRYVLSWPTGAEGNRVALGIFANPSTATEEQLDPTCKRWVNYCRAWGYAEAQVCNVRAWRETDPRLVPPDPLAIGPENDDQIMDAAVNADLIVCGWGKLGGDRGREVLALLRQPMTDGDGNRCDFVPCALKLNKDGSPAHPLYLRGDLLPQPMPTTRPGCLRDPMEDR